MKKKATSHGMNKMVNDFIKELRKNVPRHLKNNHRKMHGIPMRRKKYEENEMGNIGGERAEV